MNYPDSVRFLYSIGNEVKTAKLGLERIAAVARALGDPQDRMRHVHVAGTNGKGSTCAMIEAGLRKAGVRTGLFTSPHLQEPTERIRIDGRPISAERFSAAFDHVHSAVERLLAEGSIDFHTTYFETVAAMAFLIFAEEKVDTVALEVGLGGRLDATNIVRPGLAVVTPIDFDHENFLGTSLPAIASEKAGILKPGVPAVFAAQRPEAEETLEARAAALGIPVVRTREWRVEQLELSARGSRFLAAGDGAALRIECPLAGEHQVENALTAAIALHRLGIPAPAIEQGIAATRWPGRLEYASDSPEIVLDGAHNPAGARALARHLDRFFAGRAITLIYGSMRDKAVAEVIGILFPRAAEVIVTAPRQSRALLPETIRQMADHPRLRVAPDIDAALEMARGAGVTIVTGSLFLVAEARARLTPDPLL
jgi:dihydrofolate synthase / folylpolyglutamate synthase